MRGNVCVYFAAVSHSMKLDMTFVKLERVQAQVQRQLKLRSKTLLNCRAWEQAVYFGQHD
jgi:hypothetical protein